MVDQQVTISKGPTLDEAVVQKFKAGLRGELIRPGEGGYDDACKVWNGMIDKRPAMIAHCTGAVDVINAVNFARDNKLLVAVRGGGHNVAGNAVRDGGIVIDLSRMKGIRIDPVRQTARAEPGLTWAEFDRETQGGNDKTPYNHRDAPFIINIVGMWSDTTKNEENIKWVRDLWNAVQPLVTGSVYVNFLMTEGADRVMAAYGKKKYERLVTLKNKYDPTNFFSMNQNIKPGK